MEIKSPNIRPNLLRDPKSIRKYEEFKNLICALQKKGLPASISNKINREIEKLNLLSDADIDLKKQLRKAKNTILNLVRSELQMVTKHHFQNLWATYGAMSGIIHSVFFKIIALEASWNSLGLAISMGLLFGCLAGNNRDRQAKRKGLQLNF
ncbi:hypothetical protein [uncultured Kriegella sp.]|uniref:hypothetical protein n=1 Tax=uncultured Kriegella sp. TaxID=1798910 RepID=UPI0030D97DF2|tara:strand:- start:39428 stop:39883 length:456 start_codon:yes stop_codon:yes gene_type:complete